MNFKETLIRVFTPNQKINNTTQNIILCCWIFLLGVCWTFSTSSMLPTPGGLLTATWDLFVNDGFIRELMTSMMLCFKAMGIAIIISLLISYLSVLGGFRPPMSLVAKARFLTTIGLTFLFAQMMPSAASQKLALLVFGISVFLVTSFMGVIASLTKDDLDYARTLHMNEWETMYEIVILGKAADMFEGIRQNFAMAWMMLAMVENICRSEGGIGVILNDQNKHFHIASVYGIQIIVLCVGICMDLLLGWMKRFIFPYSTIKLQ